MLRMVMPIALRAVRKKITILFQVDARVQNDPTVINLPAIKQLFSFNERA
jgi:hypothetical protein